MTRGRLFNLGEHSLATGSPGSVTAEDIGETITTDSNLTVKHSLLLRTIISEYFTMLSYLKAKLVTRRDYIIV